VKILVTFAVASEFAPWRARHRFSPSPQRLQAGNGRCVSYDGRVGQVAVRVVLTGVGGQNATLRLHHSFREGEDLCISSGLAGGLTRSCRVGDVVVARCVSLRGTATSVASDAALVSMASECGAAPVSRFVTVEKIVIATKQKEALATSGDVVEMESYFVLKAAAFARVPAVAIRAISDTVEEDLPMDFSRVLDAQGHVEMRKLLASVAREPRRIPSLVRFGVRSHRAAKTLADFLDRYLSSLDRGGKNTESIELREAAAI
jgi:adenosylhomocysteine nucleosidase